MRATWDALASDPDAYVGDPDRGRVELVSLFERLGADPRGGTCVEDRKSTRLNSSHIAVSRMPSSA